MYKYLVWVAAAVLGLLLGMKLADVADAHGLVHIPVSVPVARRSVGHAPTAEESRIDEETEIALHPKESPASDVDLIEAERIERERLRAAAAWDAQESLPRIADDRAALDHPHVLSGVKLADPNPVAGEVVGNGAVEGFARGIDAPSPAYRLRGTNPVAYVPGLVSSPHQPKIGGYIK